MEQQDNRFIIHKRPISLSGEEESTCGKVLPSQTIAGNKLDFYLKGVIKTDREITNMLCGEIDYNCLLATVKEYKYNSSNCCNTEQLDLCVDNPLTLAAICDQLQKRLEIEKVLFVSKNYYLEYYVNSDQNLCILLYI